MGWLLARYLGLTIALVVLNFALPRLLPGDPLDFESATGMNAAVSTMTAGARAQLRTSYHLDLPLPGQFWAYLQDLSRGDLGWSISQAAPVRDLIGQRLPWTLSLMLTALIIAGVGGTLLGLVSAWRGGRLDHLIVSAASGLAAIPEFLVAIALVLGLSVGLGWFPLHGGRSAFVAAPGAAGGVIGGLGDIAWHLTLPALTLVLAITASFVLLTRGTVQSLLTAPYLATARAKGLAEPAVALRHAFPNALLPVLTLFGLRVGQVLGGAIVVERVFAVPGLGLLAFEAIRARDYPVLQAIFLLGSLGVLLVNLAVDLAYRWLEPRRGG
ncbi:MAG: ABC transporter permease [Chloroflexota bacterium]|nr:ABC transporter permease [Chloroflexota bacterium]